MSVPSMLPDPRPAIYLHFDDRRDEPLARVSVPHEKVSTRYLEFGIDASPRNQEGFRTYIPCVECMNA